ncbi:MAG: UDP-2,3-diacylglucosamine diphosphatase LpxI [Aureliella sp.]
MHPTTANENSEPAQRIGIVAGWGSFPVELAQHYRDQGAEVFVVAIKDHAAREIEQLATHCRWTGVLKIGASIRYLRSKGVEHVAFAGKIFKERILYHGRGWIDHMPDFTCIRILGSSFVTRSKDGRDDTVLSAIVAEYERRGIKVMPITDLAKHLLASEGCLTRRGLTRAQEKDVNFGWEIARQMGGLDIGQSITVKDQIVLGVEAIEGTDALIARTQTVCPRGGFTLIKVAKPDQDMRFDVPTIGPQTIERLAQAGGRGLAVEAGRTIIVELERTISLANKHSIAISVMPSETPAMQSLNNSSANGMIVRPTDNALHRDEYRKAA